MKRKLCALENCDGILYGKGYCRKHWRQVRLHGRPYKDRYELNDIIFEGGVCKIKLADTFGVFQAWTFIDIEDYERCKRHRWNYVCTDKNKELEYVQATIDKTCVKLHQFILGTQGTGIIVDHKNLNGLINTKKNLRICTHGQNQQNSNGCHERRSKYKGVFVRDKEGVATRWRAKIGHDKKVYGLGTFNTEELAASAYNSAALLLHGSFARLNEIGGA